MASVPLLAADTSRGGAVRYMRQAFAEAGIATSDLDARLLVCELAKLDAIQLITEPDRPLGPAAVALQSAMSRRLAHEPVSRILGWREFYGRRFDVTPATLDPRPDSETVIEAVLAYARKNGGVERPWRILDVGTGTGCLLITLLAELPSATGIGSDISPDALAVAVHNCVRLGCRQRAEWVLADGLAGIAGPFDIVVSNPPYIATAAIAGLDTEVRCFDPLVALDGGGDGLDLYRRLIGGIDNVIADGYVAFEIGFDQAGAVTRLFQAEADRHGWPAPVVIADLSGHARCVAQTTH